METIVPSVFEKHIFSIFTCFHMFSHWLLAVCRVFLIKEKLEPKRFQVFMQTRTILWIHDKGALPLISFRCLAERMAFQSRQFHHRARPFDSNVTEHTRPLGFYIHKATFKSSGLLDHWEWKNTFQSPSIPCSARKVALTIKTPGLKRCFCKKLQVESSSKCSNAWNDNLKITKKHI